MPSDEQQPPAVAAQVERAEHEQHDPDEHAQLDQRKGCHGGFGRSLVAGRRRGAAARRGRRGARAGARRGIAPGRALAAAPAHTVLRAVTAAAAPG